ncbi:glycosyltransferase family 2 protein [Candidatus Daviesbacteria bacterium]|nr:glycosyltransferase family 2 protein [Candidatus Daviesbacteria bacterium]
MKASEQKKLSISIVNYNSGDYLLECLKSLDKVKSEVRFDVWIADNNSSDDSLNQAKKKFPYFHYIENTENLGFAKANNQILKQIETPYVLFLNHDTKVLPKTLKRMVSFMDNNLKVGASSCLVEKADGSLDLASHRSFPTPWVSFKYYVLKDDTLYHQTFKDMTKPHVVDAIVGAFFLTRKKILDEVGFFDEDYFLYAEDIDLCFRIKKAGYKIFYVPDVKIIHMKGVSSGIKSHSQDVSSASKEIKIKSLNSFYQTMIIFYRKNLAASYPFFINWLVYLGIYLKWFLARRKLIV